MNVDQSKDIAEETKDIEDQIKNAVLERSKKIKAGSSNPVRPQEICNDVGEPNADDEKLKLVIKVFEKMLHSKQVGGRLDDSQGEIQLLICSYHDDVRGFN